MIEKRNISRHDNSALPLDLCSVYLLLPDSMEIISKLVNISALGMRLTLPTDELFTGKNSLKGQDLTVNFPLKNMKVNARCLDSEKNPNGTLSISVYFTNPFHQNMLNEVLKTATEIKTMAG